MKKFLALSTSVLIALTIMSFTNGKLDFGIKKFVGVWEYEAPYAPSGYQNGTINLMKEKKVLKGTVSIASYTAELEQIETVKSQLTCYINVEGERVQLKLDFDKNSFEGVALSSQGDIPLTGTRTSK